MANNRSLFGSLRLALENSWNRRVLEQKVQEVELKSIEAAQRAMEQAAKLVEPEYDGYVLMGSGDRNSADAGPEQIELRDAARDRHRRNPHMGGYIRTLERFVVGRGILITPILDDPGKVERCNEWWKTFKQYNSWDSLENEIPRRLWRDGEVFIRKFNATDVSGMSVEELLGHKQQQVVAGVPGYDKLKAPEFPDGMRLLRLVPPEHIYDPTGNVSFGILTSESDVQTILGYMYCPDQKRVEEIISADDMIFVKIGVDSDIKRGRSLLEPLLPYSRNYDDWLRYRIALNIARSAVVLTKKVKGSSANLTSMSQALETKRQRGLLSKRPLQMLRPLSTITHGPDVEYEFKSPQLQAQDAQHDGRAILLSLAAGTGMPEYIMTGDSSNSNYASTLVSEGPAMREFLFWQDLFTPIYTNIYRWALLGAVEAGAIEGMSVEEAQKVEIRVEWPPLENRSILEHAQANEVRFKNGVISREGFARSEGVDWELERRRLEQEGEDPPPLTIQQFAELLEKVMAAGAVVPDPGLDAEVREKLHLSKAKEPVEPEPEDDMKDDPEDSQPVESKPNPAT